MCWRKQNETKQQKLLDFHGIVSRKVWRTDTCSDNSRRNKARCQQNVERGNKDVDKSQSSRDDIES